jgi:hypothetical protein
MITGRVSREKDYRKPGRETRFFCNESVETRRERERERWNITRGRGRTNEGGIYNQRMIIG